MKDARTKLITEKKEINESRRKEKKEYDNKLKKTSSQKTY